MKYSINLASRSYVNRKALYLGYLVCGAVLLVTLIFNISYYFSLRSQIRTSETRLQELEEKILASQGADDVAGYSAARYDKVLDDIQLANTIIERDSFRWTALLNQMEAVVPGSVKIKTITPDHEKKTIALSGSARELKDMKRFIDRLIKSKHYGDVLLLQQSVEETGGIETGLKFSIELAEAF